MQTKFANFFIPIVVLLTPLFFWTLTPNFFSTPQQLIVVLAGTIATISYFSTAMKDRSFSLPSASLTIPLFAFMISITLNLILTAEGRPEALAGKGTLLLVLPIIALFMLSVKERATLTKNTIISLLTLASLLAIHSLMQLTFLNGLSSIPAFMQSKAFTPTGSFLTTLILMIVGGGTAISALKHASSSSKPFYLLTILLTTIGSVATIALMLPGSPLALNLIPYKESWSITLDSLKTMRSLFFGVGLSNFANLYTLVKPLSLNSTSLWSLLPQNNTSELLNILSTTGITGAVSLLWLMLAGLKLSSNTLVKVPLILTIIALTLTPGSIPLYLCFFILLGLVGHHNGSQVSAAPKVATGIALIGIAATAIGFLFLVRPVVAEYYMRKVQLALVKNDGKTVYDEQGRAISWAPQIANYHLSYADINMRLAGALSQKKDLTEADRSTISTLVQQAIREGKTAIQLRPNYSLGWAALGKTYRNLINVADGADKFTLDYYSKAISLDPANPLLRVEYGGIFYQLGVAAKDPKDQTALISRAKSEFQTAIQLRPTYANAYYNLSKVFETEKDYNNAYLAMQKVVANLDVSTSEYATAITELETLKSKLPKPTPSSTTETKTDGSSLSLPSPLPSPLPGGPLDLPVENITP